MSISPIHGQHAVSAHPLFDQVVAGIRPKPGRTLSPVTTLSRYLDRATAPSSQMAPPPQPSAAVDLDRITRKPLTTDDLTSEEREIVSEMGGTVARLILSMLKDDASRR